MPTDRVTLVLPSKGALADPTAAFLKRCGLQVRKPNPRQYTGTLAGVPAVDVLFQRVTDVLYKVADGTAQLGITGLDVVAEHGAESVLVISDQLGYGHCKLLIAVPDAWVDVDNLVDLADVALDFREYHGRNLRVATKFPNQTRQFLHTHGIHHFSLVNAEGAIEAAPTIGYADVIVDLTATGTTLRENYLKPLPDGVIVDSQACLIANRAALQQNDHVRAATAAILERIDATARGGDYLKLTVKMRGESAAEVAARISANPLTHGLKGPTLTPIYDGAGGESFAVVIFTERHNLLSTVDQFRAAGATDVLVDPAKYLFLDRSPTFEQLKSRLSIS
ncbi:MAG: ATP phosphoribosyltransferase [Chloroflexi bacterium]|nr:ATP phosphoribosyltransferase [Chloroflexota bacterium]